MAIRKSTAETPPSPGENPANDQPQPKKPGATRSVFIVLGISLVALSVLSFTYQIAMAIKGDPDKDIAMVAVQGIINLGFAAGGFIFGRVGLGQSVS
jgi:predicted MFS family arabinose efflux permease